MLRVVKFNNVFTIYIDITICICTIKNEQYLFLYFRWVFSSNKNSGQTVMEICWRIQGEQLLPDKAAVTS